MQSIRSSDCAFLIGASLLAVWSCKTGSTAELKVANGFPAGHRVALDDLPVQLLRLSYKSGAEGHCTGYFVRHNKLLTAAHCLDERNKAGPLAQVEVELPDGTKVKPRPWTLPPQFVAVPSESYGGFEWENRPYSWDVDVVCLDFPDNTASPEQIVEIADGPPKPGTGVILKGYGSTAYNTVYQEPVLGKTNTGYNNVAGILTEKSQVIVIMQEGNIDKALVNNAITRPGDSGSALFDLKTRRVYGTLSAGGVVDGGKTAVPFGKSYYTSLFNQDVKAYLAAHDIVVAKQAIDPEAAATDDRADQRDSADEAQRDRAGETSSRAGGADDSKVRTKPGR